MSISILQEKKAVGVIQCFGGIWSLSGGKGGREWRREGLRGSNYCSIKPGGSRLAGQAAPVDISPSVKQQHPHIRFTAEGEVKLRHPVRIL